MPQPPMFRRLVRGTIWQLAKPPGLRRFLDLTAQEINHATEQMSAGRVTRSLYQMRRPLPVGEPSSIDVGRFRPACDEEELEGVFARAFEWHPDRELWTIDRIRDAEKESWFEPEDLLLYRAEGRLTGFCWTLPHSDEHPPLGEIMVIAVDPDAAGRGLGRKLMLAGLDHLHRRGFKWAMLYVDATNVRAVKLYVDLGFVVDRIERRYDNQPPVIQ